MDGMVTEVMCTVAAGTKGALEQQGAKRFSGAFSNSKPVSSFPSPKLNAHINTGDVFLCHIEGYTFIVAQTIYCSIHDIYFSYICTKL